jgi:hypothetical protein
MFPPPPKAGEGDHRGTRWWKGRFTLSLDRRLRHPPPPQAVAVRRVKPSAAECAVRNIRLFAGKVVIIPHDANRFTPHARPRRAPTGPRCSRARAPGRGDLRLSSSALRIRYASATVKPAENCEEYACYGFDFASRAPQTCRRRSPDGVQTDISAQIRRADGSDGFDFASHWAQYCGDTKPARDFGPVA